MGQFPLSGVSKKRIDMKYLITTSLLTSIIIVIAIPNLLNSILLLTAGGVSLYWSLSYFITMQKETNLLKEEKLYFIDSFQSIRIPITQIHISLQMICNKHYPEEIRQELLRSIDCLNEHLYRLMNLKQLFIHPQSIDIAEYELGYFLKDRVNSLKDHAANKQVKLKVKTEFHYASAWIDQSKISPVIDKFIKNAIDYTEPKKTIILSISLSTEHWKISINNFENRKLIQCYKCKRHPLLKRKEELEYDFAKSIFCKKLTELCNGKILINHLNHNVSLNFPLKHSYKNVPERPRIHINENQEEKKIDNLFHKIPPQRGSTKPTIIIADSNENFRFYLEAHLSKDYIIKSFENGSEVLESIKEEHPDLIISDTVLHGMSGNELSSRLKTSGDTSIIPIILYGSHIDIDRRYKRETSLADTFLYIPFHIEDLKIEITVLIRNSRFLRKAFLQQIFGEQFIRIQTTKNLDNANCTFINKVKEFILENIDREDLTIDDIASQLCMSRTAFYNKWKLLTGEAPKFFIYRIRMEKARKLLESGKCPVNVVPEMIGLRNLKNFRNRYKEYFKITPCKSIKKE